MTPIDPIDDDHILTAEELRYFESRGACANGLHYAATHSWRVTLNRYGGWVLWRCSERLTDEQITRYAEQWPSTALEHCHARLSDEQIARLAEAWPYSALKYCSARLMDEQLAWLAEQLPGTALKYCSARLADEQATRLAKAWFLQCV